MIRTCATTAVALTLALAFPAPAHEAAPELTPDQQAQMEAYQKAGAPGPVHEHLASTVGTYDLKITSWQAPDGPPTVESGTARRSMALDGRVLVEEVSSKNMGQPFTGHGMHGYDNVTGKHWSTWNDSMSTGIMISEGSCDAKHVCTFTGSWNDPITGGEVTAHMTSRWTSPTTEVFEMHGPGPDGKQMKMMEIVYTRR